ncbi:MFS transporter [Oceanivirga miroungae]|uniref:Major facilitator superfamily protein n=1 Tax=Oceanivirga miroungae TaxID=1130046 RepID=A0A6I8MDH3_9FUSO|nr:MFS transporter [Oceanivirga miroungae]VWL85214.1 major facilitator superfamily protein [Oceanivirga miroungae]
MKEKLNKNIYRNYIFWFLINFSLTHAVWVLYLTSKGFSLFQIGIMETIYHITSFTMEIPTGAIADIYGRKTSRTLGRVLNLVSLLLMLFSNNILVIAISFVFSALGNNLESGAGEALVYDSLKELKKEAEYIKIQSNSEMILQVTRAVSLLLGGYLANISYNLTYKIAAFVTLISILQSMTFTEPSIGKVDREINIYKTFKKQFIDSVSVVKNDTRISVIIICIELVASFAITSFYYSQNLLKFEGYNNFEIGIVLAAIGVLTGILVVFTSKLEEKFGIRNLLLFLPFINVIGFILISISSLTILGMFIVNINESAMFVVSSNYLNTLIPSKQRATVLSFQSMFFSLAMIIFFPVVGKIGDIFSLNISYQFLALVAFVIQILFINLIKKKI